MEGGAGRTPTSRRQSLFQRGSTSTRGIELRRIQILKKILTRPSYNYLKCIKFTNTTLIVKEESRIIFSTVIINQQSSPQNIRKK